MTPRSRVLYPDSGFTKADAIRYYRAVSKSILPHLRNRPLSFKRYPDTIRGESFWEKDAPGFTPAWVKRFRVPRRSGESEIDYIVVNDAKTLAWIADVGGIELHPFLHVVPKIDVATHVVFDLDPGEGADLTDCCRVALLLRDALQTIHLQSLAKVSGSKGLQVYVPLNSDATHDMTEPFARVVAEELARGAPSLITAKMGKQFRRNKVFIDWSQNADYKTTVAVYSLRAKRERPYVSMPVTWDEVKRAKKLEFEPDAAIARIKKVGDLFAPVLKLKQGLGVRRQSRRSKSGGSAAALPKLPKANSQSGRRLFAMARTEKGNELWLDMRGRFKRWILRGDREGGEGFIALPAGDFEINPEYYRGEVPGEWKRSVKLDDVGAYEIIEGSYPQRAFSLWFSGRVLQGAWSLEKIEEDAAHRSWRLRSAAAKPPP